MENIKAIFFDVDETLLSHSLGAVPESARKAIEKLHKKNIRLFIATGRERLMLDKLPLEGLEFDGYVTKNGQELLDGSKNTIVSVELKGEALKEVVGLFDKKSVPMVLFEPDKNYINYLNEEVEQVQKAISTPLPPVGKFEGGILSMAVAYLDRQREPWLAQQLPHCKIVRWHEKGVDIIDKNSGKEAGIKQMLDYFHIDIKDTIAFGDAHNDVEMLQACGFGIAMGNGAPEVKAVADYVTEDIDRDGIALALRHLGLIE